MSKLSRRKRADVRETTRPKIVHLVTNHEVNDVRVAYRECRSLINAGLDVTLVAADTTNTPLPDVPTVTVKSAEGRIIRMLKTQLRAVRAARALKPTLIHFHDPELLPSAFVLRFLGHEVIYDVHEDMPKVIRSRHWLRSSKPKKSRP